MFKKCSFNRLHWRFCDCIRGKKIVDLHNARSYYFIGFLRERSQFRERQKYYANKVFDKVFNGESQFVSPDGVKWGDVRRAITKLIDGDFSIFD